MTHEEFLKLQLEKTLLRFEAEKEKIFKIRYWCLTVWVGTIALVSAEKVQLVEIQRAILPFLPIVFFWLLDGLQFVFVNIHGNSITKLENLLVTGQDIEVVELQKYSLGTSVAVTPYVKKLLLFGRCLFLTEQVVFFYGALLSVTILLAWISTAQG